jgi:lipoyl(octanoyl) transferase
MMNFITIADGVDMTDRFAAMLKQESTSYSTQSDYFSVFRDRTREEKKIDNCHDRVIDESWREKICEWLYNIVDHFCYKREIVSITLNLFDRYLYICSQHSTPVTSKLVQLIAVSALHITMKVDDSKLDHLPILLELSRNIFSAKHVTTMEKSILHNLSWKISPPTPFVFLQHFLKLMPKVADIVDLHTLYESSQFLVELSICDYYFVGIKPSSIALASLLNTIESILAKPLAMRTKNLLLKEVSSITGVLYTDEIRQCQFRLEDIFQPGDYDFDINDHRKSPVSVAKNPPYTIEENRQNEVALYNVYSH